MNINTIQIKKFDLSKIKTTSNIIIIGKRATGKSTLVKNLLHINKDSYPYGKVVSPAEGCEGFYSQFIPESLISENCDIEEIDTFVHRQNMINRKNHKTGKSVLENRAFLVLDNCLDDNSWCKERIFKELYYNGRCRGISLINAIPFPLGIPPSLRTNIDYTFIFYDSNQSNRKRIYDMYGGIFPTFEIFNQVMDKFIEGYKCLVIDNVTRSNKFEDIVFWFQSDPSILETNYQMCDSEFWQ